MEMLRVLLAINKFTKICHLSANWASNSRRFCHVRIVYLSLLTTKACIDEPQTTGHRRFGFANTRLYLIKEIPYFSESSI